MNKTELVEKIAKETGLTKKDTEAALKSFIEVVTNELSKSGEVSLIGFGTFTTAKRAARTGINPKTKEQIKIPASKFRLSSPFMPIPAPVRFALPIYTSLQSKTYILK